MAKGHDQLDEKLQAFIRRQKMFFVATAGSQGRVNLSPKGLDGSHRGGGTVSPVRWPVRFRRRAPGLRRRTDNRNGRPFLAGTSANNCGVGG